MAKYERDPVFKSYDIEKDYDIKWQRSLGSGISGPVRKCVHKETGKEYALKILLDRPKARKEVTLHWLCSGSEYIVRVIDVFANEIRLPGDSVKKKRILLVMELMEGGELFEYITMKKNFTEQEASQILRQIAMAVQYCHFRNIAHRDLKPENLLLLTKAKEQTQVKVKLADFGFAKVDNGDLTTPQFTPYYVAPQVLEAQKRQKEIRTGQRSPGSPYFYDKSCDMWSIGVILYIMLCGYPPFYSEVPHQPITQRMRKKIMSGNFDFPKREWDGISDNAKDLIRRLLCVEESERISVEDLLRHNWLVHINVPSTDLPSPNIMMDRDALEQAKAAHSEFLQGMRREENGFYLKPIGKSQNKLLANRKSSATSATIISPVNPPVQMDELSTLRDLRDVCLMPSPVGLNAVAGYADSSLVESVKKAITFNESNRALFEALSEENWDQGEKNFKSTVDRRRLAKNVQGIIDVVATTKQASETSSISVSPMTPDAVPMDDVSSLKELRDACLMPSPDGGATVADNSLVESVKKAVSLNENNSALFKALSIENWDQGEKMFKGMVDRKQLAESLQAIIDAIASTADSNGAATVTGDAEMPSAVLVSS